ncbi:MAG: hypothetical protein QM770_03030 [Tepidisphaeraceae bacterium]
MQTLERRTMLASATAAVLDYAAVTRQRIAVNFDADVSAGLSSSSVVATNLRSMASVPLRTPTYIAGSNQALFEVDTTEPYVSDGNYELLIEQDGVSPTLSGDLIATDFFLDGDFNHDRVVNFADLTTLSANYNLSGKAYSQGDANYDGTVNFTDLLALGARYGITVSPLPTSATGLIADPTGVDGTSITWNYDVGDVAIDGFTVYRSMDGVVFGAVADVPYVAGRTSWSWTDSGLTDGVKYWYRVRPYHLTDTNNDSVPDAPEHGLTTSKDWAVTTLAAPTLDRVEAGGTIATVFFTDHSASEDGYTITATEVDASGNPITGVAPIVVNAPAVTGTNQSDYAFVSGLNTGSYYAFQIQAENEVHTSVPESTPAGSPVQTSADAGKPDRSISTIYSNHDGYVNADGNYIPAYGQMYPGNVPTSHVNIPTPTSGHWHMQLTGLKEHTYVMLSLRVIFGDTSPGYALPAGTKMVMKVGDKTFDPADLGQTSSQYVFNKDLTADATDEVNKAIPTTSSTLDIDLQLTGDLSNAPPQQAGIGYFPWLDVYQYLPQININGGGFVEGFIGPLPLEITRSGTGRLVEKSLEVEIDWAGDGVLGSDFDSDTHVTMPAFCTFMQSDVTALDSDEHWVLSNTEAQIAPTSRYLSGSAVVQYGLSSNEESSLTARVLDRVREKYGDDPDTDMLAVSLKANMLGDAVGALGWTAITASIQGALSIVDAAIAEAINQALDAGDDLGNLIDAVKAASGGNLVLIVMSGSQTQRNRPDQPIYTREGIVAIVLNKATGRLTWSLVGTIYEQLPGGGTGAPSLVNRKGTGTVTFDKDRSPLVILD